MGHLPVPTLLLASRLEAASVPLVDSVPGSRPLLVELARDELGRGMDEGFILDQYPRESMTRKKEEYDKNLK